MSTGGRPDRPELAETQLEGARANADTARDTEPAVDDGTELPRGAPVGRYLVLRTLGAGGMGVVYAAYDPELDRKVALKLVRGDVAGLHHSGGRARVMREAQGIARLSHPNVVAVHDVGTSDGRLFIAMELVDGETLTDWLVKPRTVPEILGVFVQAGRGLAAAHAAGLVHRDFKPDNVLVGKDGRARVVDFGLVREVGGVTGRAPTDAGHDMRKSDPVLAMSLTVAGSLMGTPFYMAPEQLLDHATDARTDQYSFCVSLFEALAGKVPYAGTSLQEVKDKVLANRPPELVTSHKVPSHVRAAIKRGMSTDPDARFPSMEALLDELARDPSAQRRRYLAFGGIALALGAAVTIPLLLRGPRATAPTCGDPSDQIAAVWPAQRQALERAFLATKLPYAPGAFASAARQLDQYTASWIASSTEACRATHERHAQSPETLDLRMGCLQRRRTELATLVELLLEAKPRSIQRAHGAVAALSPIADCDDVAALQAPTRLPDDPSAREAIADVRDEIARVTALVGAGRFADAVKRTTPIVERARQLRYPPLEAEALSVRGRTLGRSGDEAAGRAALIEGFAAAMVSRHDEVAFKIAASLVQVIADNNELDVANEWVPIADAMLVRIGDPPLKRAAFHHVSGYLRSHEGKYAAAAEQHEKARALRERFAPGSQDLAKSLNSLAFAYDEIGRYAEARAAGERSLALQMGELGAKHPEVASVLTNLGNIASDEGDLAKAADYYRRSIAISEEGARAGDDPLTLANAINNLAIVDFELGRYDQAMAQQERALAIRQQQEPDGPDVVISLVNIGDIQRARKQYAEALATFERALAHAEPLLGADHPYVGDALLGIGEVSRIQKNLERAIPALERALAIRKLGARPIELAMAERALAYARWDRGDKPAAIELARAAAARFATITAGKKEREALLAWMRERGIAEKLP